MSGRLFGAEAAPAGLLPTFSGERSGRWSGGGEHRTSRSMLWRRLAWYTSAAVLLLGVIVLGASMADLTGSTATRGQVREPAALLASRGGGQQRCTAHAAVPKRCRLLAFAAMQVLGAALMVLGGVGLLPLAAQAPAPLRAAVLLGLLAGSLGSWGLVEQVG
jgi:hypothetical protein